MKTVNYTLVIRELSVSYSKLNLVLLVFEAVRRTLEFKRSFWTGSIVFRYFVSSWIVLDLMMMSKLK